MRIRQLKSYFFFYIFITISNFAQAQEAKPIPPSDFFPDEKTKVLMVGTIHFDYPNLDAIKTKKEDQLDVLQKQEEVEELVAYIRRFEPTKIAIEAGENFQATKKLRKYKKGDYRNERDERYQLGMRLAAALNLDTLYSIDASPMIADLAEIDSAYVSNLAKGYDYQTEDPLGQFRDKWYRMDEKLALNMNLLDYFKHINSSEHHKLGFGAYLIGDFKLEDHRGADMLSVWWYNRNLRIFRNIQKITESTEDRILVIFGNGHAAILRQLLESSPEYEFVEFSSLEKKH